MSSIKDRSRRSFGAEALLVAFSRILTRSSTFVFGILVARLVGPEGRGLLAALTIPATLAGNLAELGSRQSVAYHIGQGKFSEREVIGTLAWMLPVVSAVSIAATLGYFAFAGIEQSADLDRWLAASTIPPMIGIAYVSGIFLGVGTITAFSRVSWLPAIISLLALIVFSGILGWGLSGALLALTLGAYGGFAFAVIVLARHFGLHGQFNFKAYRSIQRMGAVIAAATFLLNLTYKLMILVLIKLTDEMEVGLYVQAAAVAELLWEVPAMVSSLVFSRAVGSKDAQAMSGKIAAFMRVTLVVTTGMAIGIALIGPWFFPFVYGEQFAESADICRMLLPGVIAFNVFRILAADFNARGLSHYSIVIVVPTLVVGLLAGWLMIGRYGVYGAAFTSSVIYVLATIATVGLYGKVSGIGPLALFRPMIGDWFLLRNAMPAAVRRRLPRAVRE